MDGEMPVPDGRSKSSTTSSSKIEALLTSRPSGPSASVAAAISASAAAHVGQVGLHHGGACRPTRAISSASASASSTRAVAMDRDGKAMRGKIFDDRLADALGAAGHQRRPGGCRHDRSLLFRSAACRRMRRPLSLNPFCLLAALWPSRLQSAVKGCGAPPRPTADIGCATPCTKRPSAASRQAS